MLFVGVLIATPQKMKERREYEEKQKAIATAAAIKKDAVGAKVSDKNGGSPPPAGDGGESQKITQSASDQSRTVYVAKREIEQNALLSPDLFEQRQLKATELKSGVIRTSYPLAGQVARRTIHAGTIMSMDDIQPPKSNN